MISKYCNIIVIILILSFSICLLPVLLAQKQKSDYSLNIYSTERVKEVKLPLKEASGIECDRRNGLLFTHEDSNNTNEIYVLNSDGTFKHKFNLSNIKNNDWEDITTDNKGNFWIIDSERSIIAFKVDFNGNLVPDSIRLYPLPQDIIGKNIESIQYIKEDNTFIAVTKGNSNKIYKFDLKGSDVKYIGKVPKNLKMKPSGLTQHPITRHFFLLAFWGHKIVEFDEDFENVISEFNLPEEILFSFQPEGICFDKDFNLVIVVEKPWFKIKGKSKLYKYIK